MVSEGDRRERRLLLGLGVLLNEKRNGKETYQYESVYANFYHSVSTIAPTFHNACWLHCRDDHPSLSLVYCNSGYPFSDNSPSRAEICLADVSWVVECVVCDVRLQKLKYVNIDSHTHTQSHTAALYMFCLMLYFYFV